jgi:protein TonB
MSYRALLFCPDEKAARTVTQVLSELEFTVEACIEPFAAVKRLMGEHFDAVVVDCDNEQNATLLFKSARNSTSNQASLAVAVVEGQAGVAKAFRIGANLVLTKPINIEQSKGTLRVARGLLRKGEPAKPGAAVAAAPAAAKPSAPKPAPAAKPAAPAVSAVATPRPPAQPAAKPIPASVAAASAVSAAPAPKQDQNQALPEITAEQPSAPPARSKPLAETKPAFSAATPSSVGFGSGAASAPAPAREPQESHTPEASVAASTPEINLDPSAEPAASSAPVPSFTFGGANVAEESTGGNKKILLIAVAVVVVAAAAYVGFTYFGGHSTQAPAQIAAPVSAQPAAKPSITPAKPASTAPAPKVSTSQPAIEPPADATTSDTNPDEIESTPDKASPSASSSTKPAGKSGTKSVPAPLVVKGGSAPSLKSKPAAAEAAAPNMIGIAVPTSSGPPVNLVSEGNAPKPVLQTLNISQGVSQGLLIKKVQPTYPRNALAMHVEGSVELMATISKTGSITTVKVISGEALLTRAAADAVKQWKYKPYLLNGEPVEIQTQVTVNFKLPH